MCAVALLLCHIHTHSPTPTHSPTRQVDRVARALAQRDELVGPYGTLSFGTFTIDAVTCVCSTDEKEQRSFEIRFSWSTAAQAAARTSGAEPKDCVIKVGSNKTQDSVSIKLPSTGLEVDPEPVNRQDPSWDVRCPTHNLNPNIFPNEPYP